MTLNELKSDIKKELRGVGIIYDAFMTDDTPAVIIKLDNYLTAKWGITKNYYLTIYWSDNLRCYVILDDMIDRDTRYYNLTHFFREITQIDSLDDIFDNLYND